MHAGPCFRAENWNVNVHTGIEIVVLEALRDVGVVVEVVFCENIVNGDELQRGPVAALLSLQAEFLASHVGFGSKQAGIVLRGECNQVGTFLLRGAWQILRGDLQWLIGGQA